MLHQERNISTTGFLDLHLVIKLCILQMKRKKKKNDLIGDQINEPIFTIEGFILQIKIFPSNIFSYHLKFYSFKKKIDRYASKISIFPFIYDGKYRNIIKN